MAAITHVAETDLFHARQRTPRYCCNAVIAFLAADRDVLITERAKPLGRELIVRAFGFLKTQNIRLIIAQKLFDQRHAQTNGIDVPGSNRKSHEDRTRSNEKMPRT